MIAILGFVGCVCGIFANILAHDYNAAFWALIAALWCFNVLLAEAGFIKITPYHE